MRRLAVVLGLVVCCVGPAVAAPTYSGSLNGGPGGGITGIPGNSWLVSGTTLSWEVTDNGNGTYTYAYRLQVPESSKEISHFIIEVSPSFTAEDILAVLAGSLEEGQPDSYPKASNVGMPSAMWGVKFEAGAGSNDYDWTMSFVSTRPPIWGDFYAVDGKKPGQETAIWNVGFTNPDTDPLAPPSSGSFLYHILVPDTGITIVPAPGAMLLAGMGVVAIGWLRQRRSL